MLRTRFKYGGDGLFLPLYLLISSLFHISLLVSGRLFARTGDPIAQDYPFKHLYASALKNLELPLWNPYEFIGLPLMGNLQVGTLYPFNLLLYGLFAPDTAWNVSYVLHFALAAYFAFLYVRLLGAGRTASFAGGLVFGFSGYITASSGHIMITSAATYLPLVMYLLERLRRERRVEHALLLSLAVAVQMLAGNFQICVYTYLVAALYGAASLLRLPREDRSRFLLLGTLGFLAGVALYLPQLVSTLDLSRASYMRMRSIFTGYEYFSTFHFYLVEFPSLWLPNLFDTWGPQDQAFPRLRTLIIVLAGVTFLLGARKSGHVLFWGAVAAAALLLASGPDTPVHKLLYRVPVYNQFRVPARHFMEFSLAATVLFTLGLDRLFSGGPEARRTARWLLIASGAVIAGTYLFLFLLPLFDLAAIQDFLGRQGFRSPGKLREAISLANPAVYTPLLFLAGYAALLAGSALWRRNLLAGAFLLVLFLDFAFGFRGTIAGTVRLPQVDDVNDLCTSEQYASVVPGLKGSHHRLLNVYPPGEINSAAYNSTAHLTCRVGALNSYNPLALDDYSLLLDLGQSGYYSLRWGHVLRNNIAISMLGAKYIAVSRSLDMDLKGIVLGQKGDFPGVSPLPLGQWTMKTGAAPAAGDAHTLSASGGEDAEMFMSVPLEAGTYEFCMQVKSRKPEKAVAVYLHAPPRYDRREALFVYPDHLRAEGREFCQVVHVAGQKKIYLMRVVTAASEPVTVAGFRIGQLSHYRPPAAKGTLRGLAAYEKVAETGRAVVYRNRNVLPRAWTVTEITQAKDIFDIRRRFDALGVDPRQQALVFEKDMASLAGRSFVHGDVGIEAYDMNRVTLSSRGDGEHFLVLSDQYHPGWRAYVDGEETAVYAVNGVLRGVVVPAGEHSVVFLFRPPYLRVLFLASGALLVLMAGYLIRARLKASA
jgi:hypothetical protein